MGSGPGTAKPKYIFAAFRDPPPPLDPRMSSILVSLCNLVGWDKPYMAKISEFKVIKLFSCCSSQLSAQKR